MSEYNYDPFTGEPIAKNEFINENIAKDNPDEIIQAKIDEAYLKELTAISRTGRIVLTLPIFIMAGGLLSFSLTGIFEKILVNLLLCAGFLLLHHFLNLKHLKKLKSELLCQTVEYRVYSEKFIYTQYSADGQLIRLMVEKLSDVKKYSQRKLARTFLCGQTVFIIPKSAFREGSAFAAFIDKLYPTNGKQSCAPADSESYVPVNLPKERGGMGKKAIIILSVLCVVCTIIIRAINNALEYRYFYLFLPFLLLPIASAVIWVVANRSDKINAALLVVPILLIAIIVGSAGTDYISHIDMLNTKKATEFKIRCEQIISIDFPDEDGGYYYDYSTFDRHLGKEVEYVEYSYYFDLKESAEMRTISEGEEWLSCLEGDLHTYFSDYVYSNGRVLIYNVTLSCFNKVDTSMECEYYLICLSEYGYLDICLLSK